jgi:hypothetical protein
MSYKSNFKFTFEFETESYQINSGVINMQLDVTAKNWIIQKLVGVKYGK